MACGLSAPCAAERVLSKKADMKSSGWPQATAVCISGSRFPLSSEAFESQPLAEAFELDGKSRNEFP